MTTNFLEKIKKQYQVQVDPAHSPDELREDFAAEIKNFLERYLAALDESLEDINSRAVMFFNKHEHQSVGAQDNFSKNFEKEVSYEIKNWIATDETLRVNFKKIMTAYSKKLKSTDMKEILQNELAKFENSLAQHVAKANAYGKSWTERMDNIGIVAIQSETRMTIKWFKNLTVEELRRSFTIDT